MSVVTSIRVRKLKSKTVGYGHVAYEVEATIDRDEGDTPDLVADRLMMWIDNRISQDLETERHAGRLSDLRSSVERMEIHLESQRRQLEETREEVDKNRQIVRQYADLAELAKERGIDPRELSQDEIPF